MKKESECSFIDCKNYFIGILSRLAAPYEEQCKSIEAFALWNLPDDLASDWENYEYFLDRLLSCGMVDKEFAEKLEELIYLFDQVSVGGELYDEKIWTHEALRNHPFWQEQRKLAATLLNLLQ